MEEVTFARNFSNLKRSESDILVMCTDAGHNASMMIFYLGKEANDGLELDFDILFGNYVCRKDWTTNRWTDRQSDFLKILAGA